MLHYVNYNTFLVLTCAFVYPPMCLGHTLNDSKTLLADKLAGYETSFRPVVNQSAPIVLYIGLELIFIQDFDEAQEKLTVTAVLTLNWVDENMRWNPADYGWLTQLVIESDKVWTPNVVLTNNIDKLEKIGDSWQIIRFTSDGISYYYPGDVLSASCNVDVTYYPWDRHKCGFSFNVWGQGSTEVYFEPITDKVQTSYFSENGAWVFYDSNVETSFDNSLVEFYLHLERKPRFVLVNVILPIVFMVFLNAVIFLIPTECGERISYSITMLLAIAVFLTLVGDNLPKTSSPMSIFSYYLLLILVVSICITFATVFSLRLYYCDDSVPVTNFWRSLVRCCNCSCIRQQRTKGKRKHHRYRGRNTGTISDREQDVSAADIFRTRDTCMSMYSRCVEATRHGCHPVDYYKSQQSQSNNVYVYCPERDRNTKLSDTNKDSVADRHTDITWKDASVAFDKIFFVLSIVLLSAATLAFFFYVYTGDRD